MRSETEIRDRDQRLGEIRDRDQRLGEIRDRDQRLGEVRDSKTTFVASAAPTGRILQQRLYTGAVRWSSNIAAKA